jgi:hypothetical protein
MSLATPIRAALPGVAAAKGPAALIAPHAEVLTDGPHAGRVAVAADVEHPADAMGRGETVRLALSRRGATLGTGFSHVRLPRRRGLTATHRVVLSAAESRRARAAARDGRLRVTASIRSDVRAASSATATVALSSTSLPPIGACYSNDPDNRTTATTLWVQRTSTGYSIVELETFPNGAGASWSPDNGFAPIGATPFAGFLYAAQWNAPGTWVVDGAGVDGAAATSTSTVSGAFAADGGAGSVSWSGVQYVPDASYGLLEPC